MQIIHDYYRYFNQQDMPAFLGLLHDDVVHDISQGESQLGRAVFADFMNEMNECYRERVSDLCVMVNESGDRAAAEFWLDGQYLKSQEGLPPARGQLYRLRVGAFFEIENGKIRRISNHYNLQDWLRQVQA